MTVEQARFNMIEQQIRPWEVLDQKLLQVLGEIPREKFVPDSRRALAYMDVEIPLNNEVTMLSPKLAARLVQSLSLQAEDTVLEIGTGSGYCTALMAKLAQRICSVEIDAILSKQAAQRLADLGLTNVVLETGNGVLGLPAHAPYNAILATGAYMSVPDELKTQLAADGRLVAVVGEGKTQEALLFTRIGESSWREESLFDTVIPYLKEIEVKQEFVF